jgi:hypothetical protein
VNRAEAKEEEVAKSKRMVDRMQKKATEEKKVLQEGVSYAPGGF